MTTKTWNNLTKHVSSLLEEADGDGDAFLAAWNSSQTDVVKMLSGVAKTSRKKKDPNAPKKGRSSYILFCMDAREKIKKAHPEMKSPEITSELGKKWAALSDKKKEKYKKKATEDKARYESEMESYDPPSDVEETPKKRGKKAKTGPKRPLSSYMYYCKDARAEVKEDHPELKGTEVSKELGRRWRELSDSEKKPYEKLAAKDRERYAREKEAPKAESADEEEEAVVVEKSPKKKRKKKGASRKSNRVHEVLSDESD